MIAATTNAGIPIFFEKQTMAVAAPNAQAECVDGQEKLDGINWVWVQDEVVYNCGVRNVVFRDCYLHQPRVNAAPDIGCVESQSKGLLLMLK